jgi:acyl-ACP thioesterase
MQEPIMDYSISCETNHFNEWGAFKLSSYQSLFASIAEQHLNRHQLNIQTTLKTGYAWVLIGLTVEILLPILEPMRLIANTWHSSREGIYFRREFVFKDESGQVRFHGASFSVLIHLEKRTIFKDTLLPFPVPFEPTPHRVVDTTPRMVSIVGLQPSYGLTVPPSFIDRLGHVNNGRYGDLAYDTLSVEEHKKLTQLKRMQLTFSSELNTGDQVSMHKGMFESHVYIRGYNETKLKSSFEMRLSGL